ncbi:hypothetical protein BTHE68_67500 (plasmid) [Burkholderia sp. THE68]|uniref:tetratricopeptide repeat protein n=1 Tax=Burkholderia sp. THE68 TaxID=758782 RepID=UPI0013167D00|nr:tetratricopeptide repeat protein [Burkholderia sp. THE68]BBU33016.1 hypothetical protein BTHE68_67500 [Burkholderia sp. THE68]
MSLFDSTLEAHRAGRTQEAESGYRAVLAENPRHADSLHLLGLICRESGALDKAEDLIRQAVALDEQALYAASLGSVLREQGRKQQAESIFLRAIELDALDPAAHYNLAIVLLDLGRAGEAETALRHVLTLDARFPGVHRNLGRAMHMLERYEDAHAFYRHAIELDPADIRAHSARAAALTLAGRLDEANAACDEAVRLDPAYGEAHLNRGAVLLGQDRLEEAEAALRTALSLDAHRAPAHYNLGTTLMEAGRLAEAEASLRRALDLDPAFVDAWHNLGRVLHRLKRMDEAESAYRSGLRLRPSDPDLEANLALVLLAKGQLAEGWMLYESRFSMRRADTHQREPGLAYPQWKGETLQGKSIVILSEQGLGDTLQFCRYLPLLKAKGVKRLTVVCEPALARLVEGIEEVDACIRSSDLHGLPKQDFWCFMMSLPLRFHTTLETVPALVPYLHAPASLVETWKMRLPSARPRIGLVWAGESRSGVKLAAAVDRRRSIHARQLVPLLQVPGATFVSLQLGATTRPQISEIPETLRPFDPMSDVTDFADTAAIIENLDLVIAVDTSTAHLAGALNRPVWVLSRFDQCWRWLTGRDDTPWYPSMRLFRQTQAGDWDRVIGRIADELKAFVAPAAKPKHKETVGRPARKKRK